MITIYDIAKKCGVSPSTVSKVVNNYDCIPLETKKRVEDTMREMNYIPNNNAKFLSKGSSNNVGILAYFGLDISPFKHTLFTEILDAFQREMNAKQYDLLFISRTVAGKDETFYKNCVSRHVDGVLMFGNMENEEMLEVVRSDLPRIGFDYLGVEMSGVSSNNYAMMTQLTEYVVNCGHRNIVYIYGDKNDVTQKRIQAFQDALAKYNIPFFEEMLVESKYLDVIEVERIIRRIMSRPHRPTTIMFPDDYSAVKGIKILESLGYRCPDDISVTGFDGIDIGQMITPQLTTIYQDSETIGRTLASKLIKYMKNKKMIQEIIEVPGSLIIGSSMKKII